MTERKKQTIIFLIGFIWHILSITQISQVYLKQSFLSTNHSFAKNPLQRLLISPLPIGNSILYLIKYSFINLNYHFFHYCTFFLCNCFLLSFSFHWGTFLWCFFSVGHFKDFILKLLPADLLFILVFCYCQINGETNHSCISKCLVNIVRNICHNLIARSCDAGTSQYLNCLKTKKDSSLSSILIAS